MIRGSENETFLQRIPVPLGMWQPFRRGGVPMNAGGPGVVAVGGERTAIWICYEQLLVWPVIQSMAERPTLILAIANDYWVSGTPVPGCQAMLAATWARLFGLPYLSAVNR